MLARVAAGLSVVAASLAVASSAQADILVTDVTTPASQSFVVSNPLAGNSNRLLIEGTTNDDDGQLLDVYCTYGAGSDAECGRSVVAGSRAEHDTAELTSRGRRRKDGRHDRPGPERQLQEVGAVGIGHR